MKNKRVSYSISGGEFTVKNYNFARPFSGFFTGIAGLYGKPMWAFFVNRAQGICSMGTESKDGAILEFQPANKAYTLVNTHGFRTFMRIKGSGGFHFYEPFVVSGYDTENAVSIGNDTLRITEINHDLNIVTGVKYFCIPGEPFTALARELIITNKGNRGISIEILDGLPFILPYGLTERQTKDMSNTIQAWMQVVNLKKKVPVYKLKTVIADKPEVTGVSEGNFYLSCTMAPGGGMDLLPVIVDSSLVFGPPMSLRVPYGFLEKKRFSVPVRQAEEGITPSAMGFLRAGLRPGESRRIYTLAGRIHTDMIGRLVRVIRSREYFAVKEKESKKYIEELRRNMRTESSSRTFDLYCGNVFVDNIMRGGYPVTLKDRGTPVTLHVFLRKHGDIERDYNKFIIQPSYYSQGDGNYRDVCQNRRSDLWFNPHVDTGNIKTFVDLIQTDGYNPLQIKGNYFLIKKVPYELRAVEKFVKKPFRIGELLEFAEINKIDTGMGREEFLRAVSVSAGKDIEAEHKEGYWIDHWTYITDLLENYRDVYPDRYYGIFLQGGYTFYDSAFVVMPKKERMVYKNGRIRQYGSVVEDIIKKEMISRRRQAPHKVRIKNGRGKIYETTLLVKLFCILANKYASLDPFGIGIEMEADKPGWNDALNGLPGLFGSSVCGTFELKRLALLVKEVLSHIDVDEVVFPSELAVFLTGLKNGSNKKETYRDSTRYGFNGREKALSVTCLNRFLDRLIKDAGKGIGRAFDKKKGIYNTYYINEVLSLKPFKVRHRPLPPFLEGQVHALRLIPAKEKAEAVYNSVRESGIYDKKLRMYKANASLDNETLELGRVKVFTPGWLENESVWVHMQYKYMLELLRNGLYKEFYRDFKDVFIPFMNPSVFGRNILESCSFIVSSAHPEPSLHGVGFLPRLTGATAEFIHIWLWMCMGKHPFFLDKRGMLNMRFRPILPGWLFKKDGTFSFNIFGSVRVTYYNKKRKDTYTEDGSKPFRIKFGTVTAKGGVVPPPYAEKVRSKEIKNIEVYLR